MQESGCMRLISWTLQSGSEQYYRRRITRSASHLFFTESHFNAFS
jgi:hypothetical protein